MRERSIEAEMTGALTSGFWGETLGGVQVLVRAVDLERARAALSDLPSGSVDSG